MSLTKRRGSISKRQIQNQKTVQWAHEADKPLLVIFKILCEVLDEYHAVEIKINSHLKFKDKILKCGKPIEIEVSQELDKIHYLNNVLTLVDETKSHTPLYVYSVKMSIEAKEKKRKNDQATDQQNKDDDRGHANNAGGDNFNAYADDEGNNQVNLFSNNNKQLTIEDLYL